MLNIVLIDPRWVASNGTPNYHVHKYPWGKHYKIPLCCIMYHFIPPNITAHLSMPQYAAACPFTPLDLLVYYCITLYYWASHMPQHIFYPTKKYNVVWVTTPTPRCEIMHLDTPLQTFVLTYKPLPNTVWLYMSLDAMI